jgi:DNA-binding ferritin-like protein
MKHWSFMPGMGLATSKHAEEELQEKEMAVELLQWLLACLRSQYWSYQQSHWQVKGRPFYGDHLLFQRLYESVQEQTDVVAEKMVGKYGPEAVDGLDLGAKFEFFIKRWSKADCLHKRGLLSEEDCQQIIKRVYDQLKAMGELSLGMDDFLMATASEHETNEYLLRQVLRSKDSARMAADDWAALTKE